MKCLTCKKELDGKWQKKFCSRSCAASTTGQGNTRNLKSGRWAKKPCQVCGKEHINKVFCSQECRNSVPRPPRIERTPERIEQIRAMKNEAARRYQAKKFNQTPPDVDIKALQEFYANCPEGHEVDHIIPISKGGLHDLPNLQYLPAIENRRKGNKI